MTFDPLAPMATFEEAYPDLEVESPNGAKSARRERRKQAPEPRSLHPLHAPFRATDELGVTRLSEVEPQQVTWIWPGRLPAGKLVVLDGDPGTGKSTLMMDLAARLSTASPMPDGYRPTVATNVVLLSAEDAADDTIRPRLDAAGGDPARVVIFDGVWKPRDEERADDMVMRPPSLPIDLDRLETLVRTEKAGLVAVDVLNAFLSAKVDGHRDQDIRTALMPLARLAEATGACVAVLRHLNKSGGGNPLYRGGGSIGIIAAARVGLLAAPDPDDESRRILAVSKSNLAAPAPALAYRLVGSPEHCCARVQWDGPTDHRAADLLTIRQPDDEDGVDASDVLVGILSDGPRWVKEVLDEAATAGFSRTR